MGAVYLVILRTGMIDSER